MTTDKLTPSFRELSPLFTPMCAQMTAFAYRLQSTITKRLSQLDGTSFKQDKWERERGGGGTTMVMEDGNLFEKGGVNFSHISGQVI